MTTLIALIVAAVTFGTVLMYGTLGEILTEKSGNLNLGVEGIMYMGGAFGLAGAFYYEKAVGTAASGPVAITIAILAPPGQPECYRPCTFDIRHGNRAVRRRIHEGE